jgi:hypothetical protein
MMIDLTRVLVTAALVATAAVSPVRAAEVSFLEAGLFFLTDLQPGEGDRVTDREIVLARYPLVAYTVDDSPCAIRIRNTLTRVIWHMDFCKIASARWEGRAGFMIFVGRRDAFCWARWVSNDDPGNYQGDLREISPRARCGQGSWPIDTPDTASPQALADGFGPSVYLSTWGVGLFIAHGEPRPRDTQRMLAALKYIARLQTPPEQRKPY